MHLSGRTRTMHIRQKHRLNIVLWEGVAFGDYYSTSAVPPPPRDPTPPGRWACLFLESANSLRGF